MFVLDLIGLAVIAVIIVAGITYLRKIVFIKKD